MNNMPLKTLLCQPSSEDTVSETNSRFIMTQLQMLESMIADRQSVERLCITEIDSRLSQIFQLQLSISYDRSLDKALASAACRLCADVSELLLLRLADQSQDKQHSIDFLQQELSRKIRQRFKINQLLQKTQAIRQSTFDLGERLGLGSVL